MLTPYSVQDALRDPALEQGWAHTLSEWETAAHSQIQATTAYVRGMRNQLLNVTGEMDSMEELERTLALGYLDLKCQWAILNVQIQYAAAHRGEIREDLMYRATCLSQLLDSVEGLLNPADVDAMTELIAEPVQQQAPAAAPPRPAPAAPKPAEAVFISRPQPTAALAPLPQFRSAPAPMPAHQAAALRETGGGGV